MVLVNTARALKYLEDFGERQAQLFQVLDKYHLLPDNFENLKLQFGFLKTASSKNFDHLQRAINVQQLCVATICTYINSILPRLMRLEQTVLELQKKITTEQDGVQIIALEYDPDIDKLQPPTQHANTVVVSMQEYFSPSQSDTSDAAESQAEDNTVAKQSDNAYYNS